MSEWKEYKLGDVATFNKNSIGKNFPFSEIEYLDTGSITKGKIDGFQTFKIDDAPSRAKRLVCENDIIYSTVRPIQRHYGIIKTTKENLVVSTGFAVITCDNKKANPDFIYYLLTNDDAVNYFDAIAEGSTSAYPSLTPNVISDFEISLPSIPDQKIIASILSSLDDKIDLLHRQNKTLEQMAETLFRQWFLPASAGQAGVEEADESWEEKGLDEIAEFLNGLACQNFPVKPNEVGLPVIKIKEMRTGITETSDIATNEIPEKYIVEDGDMLFSWSGSLDVILWSGGKGVLNQHLFKVTSTEFPQWFYYFWVKHHILEFQGIAADKATTMGHIQRHHLSNAMVIVPPKNKLIEMDETVNPVFQKIKSNTKQIRTLTQLRDTLLPKLMSGEVRVKTEKE